MVNKRKKRKKWNKTENFGVKWNQRKRRIYILYIFCKNNGKIKTFFLDLDPLEYNNRLKPNSHLIYCFDRKGD